MKEESNISFELLADYVDGLVDLTTADRIGKQLEQDENLRTVVEGIHHFYETKGNDRAGLEEYLDKLQARFEQTIGRPDSANEHHPIVGKGRLWLRIAAIVLVLALLSVTVYYMQGSSSAENLVSTYLEEPYRNPVVSRSATVESKPYQDAINAYIAGDFPLASEGFMRVNQSESADVISYFYGGLSALYSDDAERAIVNLEQAVGVESNYYDQALWYLSLAYYRAERADQAKELLSNMVKREDHYRNSQAATLLKKLE